MSKKTRDRRKQRQIAELNDKINNENAYVRKDAELTDEEEAFALLVLH